MAPIDSDPELNGFSGLLVLCRPEVVFSCPVEGVLTTPGIRRWELATSLSAQALPGLRQLAGRYPLHASSDLGILLGKLTTFDLVVVSPLSLNTLAKFALGIQDSFPSRLLISAAHAGLPILLDESTVPLGDSALHPHFVKIYRRYWQDLQSSTISGFRPETLLEAVDRLRRGRRALERKAPGTGRAVITRDEVREAYAAMTPLRVSRGALVTDLAREDAQALGVEIRFE